MVYADFNSTTPLCPSAVHAIERAFTIWGNPSSTHRVGRQARQLLEDSRDSLAKACEVKASRIVFTSGGSEANSALVLGSFFAHPADSEFRVLSTPIEHSSVLGSLRLVESKGAKVDWVKISARGDLDLVQFSAQLDRFQPHLVSVMTANNETGVLFPIAEIHELCQQRQIRLHTDAVQAFGKIPPSFWNMASAISLSAHKIGGPKGAGALIVEPNTPLEPLVSGGSQETKRRGGTQNLLGIAGFAGAAEEIPEDLSPKSDSLRQCRDRFETRLREKLSDLRFHGAQCERLPNTSCIGFDGIRAEVLLSAFDLDNLCVSVGSACSSGSISPSHVLLAMGLSEEAARQTIRFSWHSDTSLEDIDRASDVVINHVERIRSRRAHT